MSAQPTILFLSGPSLNMPGLFQPEIDRSQTFAGIVRACREALRNHCLISAASRGVVSDLGSLGSLHAPDALARWTAEATA